MGGIAAVSPSPNSADVFLISSHCLTAEVHLWLSGLFTLSQPLCQPLYSVRPDKQPHPWWSTSATAQKATTAAVALPLLGRASLCVLHRGDVVNQRTVSVPVIDRRFYQCARARCSRAWRALHVCETGYASTKSSGIPILHQIKAAL